MILESKSLDCHGRACPGHPAIGALSLAERWILETHRIRRGQASPKMTAMACGLRVQSQRFSFPLAAVANMSGWPKYSAPFFRC
jgi:hypothetical protein